MSGRDTQFAGFAKLLWDDLINANGLGYIDVSTDFDDGIGPTNYQLIIAQRAHDLSMHILKQTMGFSSISLSSDTDMTEWPEQEVEE